MLSKHTPHGWLPAEALRLKSEAKVEGFGEVITV